MINATILDQELKRAGIEFVSVRSTGEVISRSGEDIQLRPDVAEIIAAHDPWPYVISPTQVIAKAGVEVAISVQAKPPSAVLLVDGVEFSADIDADGKGQVILIPDILGDYVVTGKTGALADQVIVLSVV